MNNLFQNLTTRERLFLIIFLSSLFVILCVFLYDGWQGTILIGAIVCAILIITRGIWLPESYGKTQVRKYSLQVALTFTIFIFGFRQQVELYFGSFLQWILPEYFEQFPVRQLSPGVAFVFLFLIIVVVNYANRDKSAMKADLGPVDKEFPDWDYKKERAAFCKILRNQIERIDYETDWSREHYTTLEAEVEIENKDGVRRKVDNLLKALKKDRKSDVFLVLGNPGSGKSVSLRKLAVELLDEVVKTDKIPIYVNLKEWKIKEKWTEDNPPTSKDVYAFVFQSLKGIDVFADEFLDQYFNKMFKNGRFFLILDSFDEIPVILDKDESSWLVDKLSEVIFQFIYGAHQCRGVLSSRYYRKPTDKFKSATTFHINPFSTNKVYETLSSTIKNENLLKQVINRNDLVDAAKTPFLSSLISSYIKRNQEIPSTKFDLYDNYIKGRLGASSSKLREAGLSIEEVSEVAVGIANVMFKNERLGLEAPLNILEEALPNLPVSSSLKILKYARIGRIGDNINPNFSFVHRRFNEFFVVDELIKNPKTLPKESIPTDSRWRDALVLYCEIAEEEQVKKIVDFCWDEIKALENESILSSPRYYRGIHALRFLIDAFRNRLNAIEHIENDLFSLVLKKVESRNLLEAKLATEATGILAQDHVEEVLINAMYKGSSWINDTVIESCKHLDTVSLQLSKRIYKLLIERNFSSFSIISPIRHYFLKEEINYASLIKSFTIVKKFLKWTFFERIVVLLSLVLIYVFFIFWSISRGSIESSFQANVEFFISGFIILLLTFVGGITVFTYISPPTKYVIHGLRLKFELLSLKDIQHFIEVLLTVLLPFISILFPAFIISFIFYSILTGENIFHQLNIEGDIYGSNFFFSTVTNFIIYFSILYACTLTWLSLYRKLIIKFYYSYLRGENIDSPYTNDEIDRDTIYNMLKRINYPAFQYIYISDLNSKNVTINGNWKNSPYVMIDEIEAKFSVLKRMRNTFFSIGISGDIIIHSSQIKTLLAMYEEKTLFGRK